MYKVRIIADCINICIKLFKESSLLNVLRFFKFLGDAEKSCKSLNKPVWYLESLAVDNLYQGQSLGSKMINDCLIHCIASHGGEEVALITNSEINLKFYTKNGFKEFNNTTIYFKNSGISNWSYYKKLQKKQ